MVEEKWEKRSERVLAATVFSNVMPGMFAGFTTRHGGVSKSPYATLNMGFHVGDDQNDVQRNRSLVAADIGFPLTKWIGSEQVHQAEIAELTAADAGRGADCLETALPGLDGIYTQEQGLLLTSLYADCVPLYFAAKSAGLIGLCHAGWKGSVAKIGPKLVGIWKEKHRVSASDVYVLIGPSIRAPHYEVDEVVASKVKDALGGEVAGVLTPTKPGHSLLDLPMLNKQLLIASGVNPSHIHTSTVCTYESDAFFSHRKEKGRTGRMMSAIGLQKG